MCSVLLPPGVNCIAVSKIYQIEFELTHLKIVERECKSQPRIRCHYFEHVVKKCINMSL